MVENLDVLLSVAEISVAFAGFAGIITAVAGRSDGGLGPRESNAVSIDDNQQSFCDGDVFDALCFSFEL